MDLKSRNRVRQQRKSVLAKKTWRAFFALLVSAVIAHVCVEVVELDELTGTGVVGRIFCVVPVLILLIVFLRKVKSYERERWDEREDNRGPRIQGLNLDGKSETAEQEYEELKPL